MSIRVSKSAVYATNSQCDDRSHVFVAQLDERRVACVIKVIDHGEACNREVHTQAEKQQVWSKVRQRSSVLCSSTTRVSISGS